MYWAIMNLWRYNAKIAFAMIFDIVSHRSIITSALTKTLWGCYTVHCILSNSLSWTSLSWSFCVKLPKKWQSAERISWQKNFFQVTNAKPTTTRLISFSISSTAIPLLLLPKVSQILCFFMKVSNQISIHAGYCVTFHRLISPTPRYHAFGSFHLQVVKKTQVLQEFINICSHEDNVWLSAVNPKNYWNLWKELDIQYCYRVISF